MTKTVQTFLLLLCLVIHLTATAQDTPDSELTQDVMLDALKVMLDDMTKNDEFAGTVLIAHHGEIIFEGAYGLANREAEIANNMETLFNLASMNKMFTSVAIAQLVEQNLIAYDATIGTYLNDITAEIAETVTVHQLLTHTSGLADYFTSTSWQDYVNETNTVRGYFPIFINEPLHFAPGEQFEYANSNFIVLGAIIEAVTGEDYFDYVREHIYQDAGMVRTDTYLLSEMPDNFATGYTIITPEGHPGDVLTDNTAFLTANGSPAGGGYGTAHDLIAFSDALFNGTLLSTELVDTITSSKVNVPIPGLNMRYAYGFEIRGSSSIGHSGGFPGVSSAIGIFPESGYTYVVLSNTDMGGRTVMMYLEEQFEELINQPSS